MKKNWIVGYCVSFVICLGLTTGSLADIDLQQPSINIGDVQFASAAAEATSDVESSSSPSILSSSLVELSFRSHIKRNTAGNNSSSSRKEAILNAIKQNNHKIIALVDKSVTLTCSIDLDDKTFSKSQDYKIIWSREIDDGKDYEPLALDDNRLVSNQRITPTRTMISNSQQNRIEWSLVIKNVRPSDGSNYICQLNRKPYDIYWLKRFMLSVYEPAYFVDSREMSENVTQNSDMRNAAAAAAAYENSVFVKSINESQDFKLKCLAKGKPRPTVSWHIRFFNNTLIHLNMDENEIVIKNLRRNSKIDKVECQATNGYGATAIRSFKINIKHSPHIISKPKSYNVPTKTNEMRLNCTLVANPQATVSWLFLPRESILGSMFEQLNKNGVNQTKQTQLYLDARAASDWVSLNHKASYQVIFDNPLRNTQQEYSKENYYDDYNTSSGNAPFPLSLPLSKYQISDKHSGHNFISSVLVIKTINQKDSGLYRCLASNELGNKTLDFKMTVLEHDESSEKQRIKNKKNPYSMERSKTFKHSTKNKSENENSRSGASSHQQDFVSESEEYLNSYGNSGPSLFMSHHYLWTTVLICLIIPLVFIL